MKKRIFYLIIFCLAPTFLLLAQTNDFSLLKKYKSLTFGIEKAKKYFIKEDWSLCEKELNTCLEKLPEHHEAHYLMSQLLYKKGKFDKALEHIILAESGFNHFAELALSSQQEKLKKNIEDKGQMTDTVGQLEKARDQAKERGSCQPEQYETAVQEGANKLANAGKFSEEVPSKLSIQIPAEYHFFHGNCLFRLKRIPEAEEQYQAAIKTDPLYANAYNNLINLYYIQKRFTEAKSFLNQAEIHHVAVHPELKKAVNEAVEK